MSARTLSPLLLILAGLSCAYYNGLYNANQLAQEARKAEREGRRGEARSLWAQASVKAESVTVRYRESKHRDDALLLQGLALSRMGSCRDAVRPLGEAVATSPDTAVQADAGRLGRADSARQVLSRVVATSDSAVGSQALWWRGRAFLAMGQPEEALRDLLRTRETPALFDRAMALIELDRGRAAAAALDSALAVPYDERRWNSALERVGAEDVRVASGLVDRLLQHTDLTSGQHGRLLLADAGRWGAVDPARAKRRFEEAAQAAKDSVEGRLASAQLYVGEIRRTTNLDRLEPINQELNALIMDGGVVVGLAGPVIAVLERVISVLAIAAGGEAAAGDPAQAGPDLQLFLRAEELRDSLAALPLATQLFLRVKGLYPSSVIAPKALLAAAAIADPRVADSLIGVLVQEYPDSPYTLAALGQPTSEFTMVEDSLSRLLAPNREGQPGERRPGPRSPGEPMGDAGPEGPASPLALLSHGTGPRPSSSHPTGRPAAPW